MHRAFTRTSMMVLGLIRKTYARPAGVAALAFVLAGFATSAHAEDARPTPRLSLPRFELKADDQFRWFIPIMVVNPTEGGIYTDSLRIEIEDLDPGRTRRSRRYITTDTTIARGLPSVSLRDSAVFRYVGSAFSENARVTLRLYSHGGDGTFYESPGVLTVAPGMMSDALRSRFLRVGKDSIEYVVVPETWPSRRSPGLLIINGWESHARLMLPTAWHLANQGYTVMVMSLPGYGLSSGSADLGGPRSLAAVEHALNLLRRSENVDSTRVAVWGTAQGAITALQLAAKRPDLKAVLGESGLYDLEVVERTTSSEDMRRMIAQEAGPKGGWKRRSATAIRHLKIPVMLLHGEYDTVAPLSQANDYVTHLKAEGLSAQLRFVPHQGHRLNPISARDAADDFLKDYLSPLRKGRQ